MLATKPRIKVRQQNIYNRTSGKYSFSLFYARWSERIGTISTFTCGEVVTQYHQHQTEGFVTYIAFANKPLAESWQKYLYLRFGDIDTELRKINRFNTDLPGEKPKRGKWELKVSGLTFEQFGKLLELEVSTEPPTKNSVAVASDFKVGDRVKVKWTLSGSDDWRIGQVGTVKRVDAKVNRIEILLDSTPYTLSLEPSWIEKVATEAEAEAETAPEEVTEEVEQAIAPTETNKIYLVNDKVEIGSDRHGKDLVWELGNVTATDFEGATVEINGSTYYFLNDEIALLRDTLFTPEPKPTFSFIAASGNNNLSQQYHCYEGNHYIGKIDQLPISGKWIIKHDRREFDSRETATTALKLKLEADKRLHDETNKAMLNRFLSA